MKDKIIEVQEKYNALTDKLAAPDAMQDMDKWREQLKEHAALEPIYKKGTQYIALLDEIESLKQMADDSDAELAELAALELDEKEELSESFAEEVRLMLLPKDPNDDKNVVIEIRAGTGGDEAALFGADLYRMYTRFAERHGYKIESIGSNGTDAGGLKEAIFVVIGKGAYSQLKYESGVHRVQRVPETESSGRIHTSAATVAVLPEAEDVEININPNELQIDVYRAGGHGGQSVNTTDSAVRITHLPTGMVVTCQDERSQLKNKEKAMRVLNSRLLDYYRQEQDKQLSQDRKSQVGSGDRSERIRTYNFPQGRVTDHRINLTLYKLEDFMDGDLDEMISALALQERSDMLAGEI